MTIQTGTPIVHEGYDPASNNHVHDIAVIPLTRKVNFTNYVRPICLLRKPSNQKMLWVSGWGRTETGMRMRLMYKTKILNLNKNSICRFK